MMDRAFIYASRAGIHASGFDSLVAFLDGAVRHDWHSVLRTAHATIIVRTPAAAESILRSIPQRALPHSVLISPCLHAKVFVASNGDAGDRAGGFAEPDGRSSSRKRGNRNSHYAGSDERVARARLSTAQGRRSHCARAHRI